MSAFTPAPQTIGAVDPKPSKTVVAQIGQSLKRGTLMALYLVTHVQLDGTGEVARVRWLTPDYSKNGFISKFEIVDVAEVVTAIERGDIVEMRFDGPFGPTSAGRLSKKLLPNGMVTIAEEMLVPGRSMHDLPRI